MRHYHKDIIRLLKQIPSGVFECRPGCVECCTGKTGPLFQCTWAEWDMIEDKRLAQYPISPCPYLGPDGCDIYEVRPFICRLFGLVPSVLQNIPRIGTVRFACHSGGRLIMKLPDTLLRKLFIGFTEILHKEAMDAITVGAQPIPAGPYGMWILDDVKRARSKDAA